MASRILHLAVIEEIMKQIKVNDSNRFRLGCIMPDAYNPEVPKADSHLKIFVCGKSKKTYDLDKFISLYKNELKEDELYKGYYLHLIQDLIFRELIYDKYKWNPTIPGNVERLHNDYRLINLYVIKKYRLTNNIQVTAGLKEEKIYTLYPFETESFLSDMENDFACSREGEYYFFTKEMADEFIAYAAETCIRELQAIDEGGHYVDAYARAWLNKPFSLLRTTQNTRDLGGYRTKEGKLTAEGKILRSDVQNFPVEEDYAYLKSKGITTIIDLRGQKDIDSKPSGFAGRTDFEYFNFPINEGSGVPDSVENVPKSYMQIAKAHAMPEVFKCIANTVAGVMFNCTAGKDRTGVVSAILLLHVEVSDEDIIENYVLTKEYGKERLELVHKNFPEIDMNIVTPCEMFMKEFLRLFREEYGDTHTYFRSLGLEEKEIQAIREKLY